MEKNDFEEVSECIMLYFYNSGLSANQFAEKNLENIKTSTIQFLIDSASRNELEHIEKVFYEEHLINIRIKVPDYINKSNETKIFGYIQQERMIYFEKRNEEFSHLINIVLPKFLKVRQSNINKISLIDYNSNNHLTSNKIIEGLNYYKTNNDAELDELFNFFIKEKLIESINKREFKVLFRETIDNDYTKMQFTCSASLFARITKEMCKMKQNKKLIFQRKGVGYHHILDNVFEKIITQNGFKKPSEIMNTNHIPKKEEAIYEKFTIFLKANFKAD